MPRTSAAPHTSAGAVASIPDRDGVTALEHARARGYDEIAGLLSR